MVLKINLLKSIRWQFRTWLNKNFWNKQSAASEKPVSSRIIVGLTTTPRRIEKIVPVLNSVLNQTCPPDEIHLNIPLIFKREGTEYVIPEILLSLSPKIKIIRMDDMGPGTKIIPTLTSLPENSDTIVITADDDILMLPKAIEVIAEAFSKNSSNAYGLSGYTLGPNLKPIYHNRRSPVQVLEGYAHFAVHRKVIGRDFTDYLKLAHSIPSGYLHDDIVIANYFALKNVERIQLFDPRANRRIIRKRGAQLHYGVNADALHNGGGETSKSHTNAHQTRQASEIANLMRRHGLWALQNADESNSGVSQNS